MSVEGKLAEVVAMRLLDAAFTAAATGFNREDFLGEAKKRLAAGMPVEDLPEALAAMADASLARAKKAAE